jgi:RimJ/RimL family protein N-acetyltransferase
MIEGRNVRLRAIEPSDLEFLAELADDPVVHSHVVGWAWPVARHGQAAWLQRIASDTRNRRLIVADRDDNPLGMTGLWDIDLQNRSAQSAIKLHSGALDGRRGTATDALKTMLAAGFSELGLNRVWAVILDYNQASLALYTRKVGFKIEGRRRQEVYRSGAFRDLYHLAILRSEWEALPDSAEYAERLNTAHLADRTPVTDEYWA